MKKLLIILLLIIPTFVFSQRTINQRGIVKILYGGDTLELKFDGDSALFDANNNFYKFDGSLIVDSVKINGIWYNSLSGNPSFGSQYTIQSSDGVGGFQSSPNFKYQTGILTLDRDIKSNATFGSLGLAAAQYWRWDNNYFTNTSLNGSWLRNATPSGTSPNIGVDYTDNTSGFGSAATGRVNFIASGTNSAEYEDDYFRSNVNFEIGTTGTNLTFSVNDTSGHAKDIFGVPIPTDNTSNRFLYLDETGDYTTFGNMRVSNDGIQVTEGGAFNPTSATFNFVANTDNFIYRNNGQTPDYMLVNFSDNAGTIGYISSSNDFRGQIGVNASAAAEYVSIETYDNTNGNGALIRQNNNNIIISAGDPNSFANVSSLNNGIDVQIDSTIIKNKLFVDDSIKTNIGYIFPDGTIQTTSAGSSGVVGTIQQSNGSGGFTGNSSLRFFGNVLYVPGFIDLGSSGFIYSSFGNLTAMKSFWSGTNENSFVSLYNDSVKHYADSSVFEHDVKIKDALYLNNDTTKIYWSNSTNRDIVFQNGDSSDELAHLRYRTSKASAYLPVDSAASTTLTTQDEWYFINGNFVNEVGVDFGVDGDTLQYQCVKTNDFRVDFNASFAVSTPNRDIEVGVMLNDSIILGTVYPRTFSSAGDYGRGASQYVVLDVANNDKIKLVARCTNASGTVVTFNQIQAVIKEW